MTLDSAKNVAAEESQVVSSTDTDLRRFRRRVLSFFFPCLLFIPWLPVGLIFGQQWLERAKGPTNETQINQSFRGAEDREYELLLLGNSRVYRGLNPDRFSVSSYNFGCNDDTFNHMYFKLKWLRDRNISFRYLAMGVDLFQFSYMSPDRNYVYSRYFGDAYLDDYEPRTWADAGLKVRKIVRSLNPKYMFMPNNGRTFLRDNGQFIKPGKAAPTDTAKRSTRRMPVQVGYFEKILTDCRKHGVKVWLCMLPIRPEEQNAYRKGEIDSFMEFIREYVTDDVVLIDYTFDDSYVMSDYTDITHINEAAAERLSVQLNESIMSHLGSAADRSQIISRSTDNTTRR
ncbi:MAG: DUF1574 domain-containing protein [Fuerstiella sp.]|nr:DUF1574 domain-containing protein [Fuerstiella sp.]